MSVGKLLSLCVVATGIFALAAPMAEAKEREPVKAEPCGDLTFDSGETFQLMAGNVTCEEATALARRWWSINDKRGPLRYVEIDGWRCGAIRGLPICGKEDKGVSLLRSGQDTSGIYFGSIPERPRLYISRGAALNFARRALVENYGATWSRAVPRRVGCGRRFGRTVFRCFSTWRTATLNLRSVMRVRILPPRGSARVRVIGQTVSTSRSETLRPVVFDRSSGDVIGRRRGAPPAIT